MARPLGAVRAIGLSRYTSFRNRLKGWKHRGRVAADAPGGLMLAKDSDSQDSLKD